MSFEFPELPASFLRRPLAHRGLHDFDAGAPENSRAAFRAAIRQGFGIELDLQMSQDGEAMVFHDYGLNRLTHENGALRQHSAEDLRAITLVSGGESIPDLAEVLALIDGQVPVLLELKDQDGAFGPDVGPLEQRTAELLQSYRGDVAIMSFNPNAVVAMRGAAPDIARGLTTDAFRKAGWPMLPHKRALELREIPDFDRAGCSFISHSRKYLDTAPVARIKARGLPVLSWTIRNAADAAKALEIADNITFEGYIPA